MNIHDVIKGPMITEKLDKAREKLRQYAFIVDRASTKHDVARAVEALFKVTVEGVLTVDGDPTAANRWIEGTRTVTVSDGRLTIANGAGASNNKLCFVEVTPAG